jgi:hypothetical protein
VIYCGPSKYHGMVLSMTITKIPTSVFSQFEAYSQPRINRELQNVIERSMIDSSGSILSSRIFSPVPA